MIKINLVPAEILAKARQRQQNLQLGAAAVLVLAVVVMISLGHYASLTRLEGQLAADNSRLEELKKIVALVDQEDAATKAVNEHLDAIGSVRTRRQLYPTFMSDFVQSVPAGSTIRVKSLNTTGGGTAAAAAPAKGKGAAAPTGPASGSLKLDIMAEAGDYNDIALWIKSLENYGRDLDLDAAPAPASAPAPAAPQPAPAPAAPAPAASIWDRLTGLILTLGGHPTLPPHSDAARPPRAAAAAGTAVGAGPLVDDPRAAAEAMAVLGGLSKSSGGPMVHPWKIVTCGPAFWRRLQARDAALGESGESAQLGKPGQVGVEGRSFYQAHGDAALYRSPVLQQWAKMFTVGEARPARPAERDFFYAMTPFELKDQPVTIVEAAGERLLIYADKVNQNLWLEFAPVVHHEGTFSGVDMGAVTRADGTTGTVYSFTLSAAYAAGKPWRN
jgi:hypothetical protein